MNTQSWREGGRAGGVGRTDGRKQQGKGKWRKMEKGGMGKTKE